MAYALHSQRENSEEWSMSKKQNKPVVRKPSKKIADPRRVRYGASSAPRAIRDSGAIRFGASSAPASLRK